PGSLCRIHPKQETSTLRELNLNWLRVLSLIRLLRFKDRGKECNGIDADSDAIGVPRAGDRMNGDTVLKYLDAARDTGRRGWICCGARLRDQLKRQRRPILRLCDGQIRSPEKINERGRAYRQRVKRIKLQHRADITPSRNSLILAYGRRVHCGRLSQ